MAFTARCVASVKLLRKQRNACLVTNITMQDLVRKLPMAATYLAIFTQADIQFSSDICKIILAVILPPLGVFLERGCNVDFLINILLTILGYIPGIIHAL